MAYMVARSAVGCLARWLKRDISLFSIFGSASHRRHPRRSGGRGARPCELPRRWRTPAWWRATLLTTWCAGLIWTLLYATFSVVTGVIGGVLAVGIGIAGYRTVGGPRNLFWRVQMASMLPIGVFICMHPLADWRNGVPQTWLSIPVGLLFVITACWGLWPDGRQPAPQFEITA